MLEVTLDNMEELYGYGPDKVIEMKALWVIPLIIFQVYQV